MPVASFLEDSWLRPAPSLQGVRKDATLAAALLVAGLVAIEVLRAMPGAEQVNQRLPECFLWSVAITAPLALRRIFPVGVMVVCSLAFYGVGSRVPVASGSIVIQAALFMAIYAAWAWSRHRRRLLVASAVVVLGMFVWLAQLIAAVPATADTPGLFSAGVAIAVATLAINVVYFFGAIAWGLVSYRDAHRRQLLVEQAEALRREQERNAERAVAEDRLRIARDLHDAVAHHVTGIGVQAAAARHVLDRDPASSRTALQAIERSSRSAVHEMHQIVGLLRDEDDHDARAPGIAALGTLARDTASDRLAVRYREVGDPFDVPDPVGTSAFRTAQEALTNVRRHSTAREAEMVLRYLDGPAGRAVEVEVLDAGSPAHRTTATDRRGFGLQGLRERAAVHDAVVDIGPRPEGGFRVRVRFPVREVAHEPAHEAIR